MPRRNQKERLEYQRAYYQKNKEKILRRKKEEYLANPDVIKQRVAAWTENNRDEVQAYQKEYASKNKSRILNRAKEYRKQNKEEISEKKKRYRVENPDAVRLANQRLQRRFSIAKYRAKKHGMDFKLSFDDYSKVVSDGLCHYCGKEIPKSGSGLDRKNEERFYAVENCVPCCCRCNTAFMANFTYEEKLVIAAAIKTVDERRARLNEDVT